MQLVWAMTSQWRMGPWREMTPPPEGECGTESQIGAPWRAALANAITPLEVAPQDHDYFVLVNMINMTTNIGMSSDRVTDSVLT